MGKIIYIGVIGSGTCNQEIRRLAVEVGEELAQKNAVVLCGGRGGVMEAVALGATRQGGTVIGILPGTTREEGNPHLTFAIPTGLGEARNAIITRAADAVIAISGGTGTLSEIALALKMGKTVVGLYTWQIIPPVREDYNFFRADTPRQAVQLAVNSTNKGG